MDKGLALFSIVCLPVAMAGMFKNVFGGAGTPGPAKVDDGTLALPANWHSDEGMENLF